MLKPDSAEIAGTYCGAWYEGQPAVLCNRFGKGTCWTYGSAFSEEAVLELLSREGISSPAEGIVSVPESVEVAVRGRAMFLMNYLESGAKVTLNAPKKDILSGDIISGEAEIPGFGVMVLDLD